MEKNIQEKRKGLLGGDYGQILWGTVTDLHIQS